MSQSHFGASFADSAVDPAHWSGLRTMAFDALERAYAPYSRFRVGAAVQSSAGRAYPGFNIENASYPASLCAERVAMATAMAAGAEEFVAMVIATEASEPAAPCGICRQVMAELAPRLEIVSCTRDGGESWWPLSSLLPHPFTSQSLGRS